MGTPAPIGNVYCTHDLKTGEFGYALRRVVDGKETFTTLVERDGRWVPEDDGPYPYVATVEEVISGPPPKAANA